MNQFERQLVEEFVEACGSSICDSDWDEFNSEIEWIEEKAKEVAFKGMEEADIDDNVLSIAGQLHASRADLPSLNKFIYTEIEEQAK